MEAFQWEKGKAEFAVERFCQGYAVERGFNNCVVKTI